jgi:hypothetical protein
LALTLAAALAGVACLGCTTTSLERYTVSQIQSAADYRSEAALRCLAAVAANPGALPAFATLADGATSVKDTATLSATTTWTRAIGGFATQALAPMLGRSPNELWTVDPVADHTRLEAMRCACRWVLYGPERACADCAGILADPVTDHSPGPHFGVAARLERMPAGWLHVGRLKDVPVHARFKAHCGDTWAWVMPDGTAGLAEFVLVLHDIATIDIDFGATVTPPVLVTLSQARLFAVFKLTPASLDALLADKVDARVVEKLRPFVNRPFDSADSLVKAIGGGLTEAQLKGAEKKILERAQQPDKSFEITEAALAALTQEIKDRVILEKLRSLKSKRFSTVAAFREALASELTEAELQRFQAKILKQVQQVNLPFSKQVTYSDIRVIDPGFLGEIKKRIEKATASGERVAIRWQEWQEHTRPYHGTRTNVKADAVQPAPQALPTRPFELLLNVQGVEVGYILREVSPPVVNPFKPKK